MVTLKALSYNPLDQLHAEWTVVSRSRASREAVRMLCNQDPAVASLTRRECGDLGDLVEALRRRSGAASREQAAHAVRAMLRLAPRHPLVARAVLQSLVPGLVNVARGLSWGAGGDWLGGGQFLSDVIATAWEVITDWSGQDRPYAVLDLLSAIRCRLRRQLAAQMTARERAVPAGACALTG